MKTGFVKFGQITAVTTALGVLVAGLVAWLLFELHLAGDPAARQLHVSMAKRLLTDEGLLAPWSAFVSDAVMRSLTAQFSISPLFTGLSALALQVGGSAGLGILIALLPALAFALLYWWSVFIGSYPAIQHNQSGRNRFSWAFLSLALLISAFPAFRHSVIEFGGTGLNFFLFTLLLAGLTARSVWLALIAAFLLGFATTQAWVPLLSCLAYISFYARKFNRPHAAGITAMAVLFLVCLLRFFLTDWFAGMPGLIPQMGTEIQFFWVDQVLIFSVLSLLLLVLLLARYEGTDRGDEYLFFMFSGFLAVAAVLFFLSLGVPEARCYVMAFLAMTLLLAEHFMAGPTRLMAMASVLLLVVLGAKTVVQEQATGDHVDQLVGQSRNALISIPENARVYHCSAATVIRAMYLRADIENHFYQPGQRLVTTSTVKSRKNINKADYIVCADRQTRHYLALHPQLTQVWPKTAVADDSIAVFRVEAEPIPVDLVPVTENKSTDQQNERANNSESDREDCQRFRGRKEDRRQFVGKRYVWLSGISVSQVSINGKTMVPELMEKSAIQAVFLRLDEPLSDGSDIELQICGAVGSSSNLPVLFLDRSGLRDVCSRKTELQESVLKQESWLQWQYDRSQFMTCLGELKGYLGDD